MAPKSLLFSSDQETSRLLGQALLELGFEVEYCVEIFAAVEKLTGCGFDVIVADWDDGVEAGFLLKTARELKSNNEAFAIALTRPEQVQSAQRAGTNVTLNKPLLPGQARQTLMGVPEFATRFAAGAKLAPSLPEQARNPYNHLVQSPPPAVAVNPPSFLKTRQRQPSPATKSAEVVASLQDDVVPVSQPVDQTVAPITGETLRRSHLQGLFSSAPQVTPKSYKLDLKQFWRGSVYGFFLLACGNFLYGPVRSGAVTMAARQIFQSAADSTHSWIRIGGETGRRGPTLAAFPPEDPTSLIPDRTERITVEPRGKADLTPPEVNMAYGIRRPIEVLAQVQPLTMPRLLEQTPQAVYEQLPQSLKNQPQLVSVRDSAVRPTPSLLAVLEPVSVDEEVSDKLVVLKVQPVYPDQAVRAGMQGTVVLQALIDRQGLVEDLKLVRGSLLLGEAAFQAVRQWRYQPYFVNGHPVQTQTMVTVDFKLPAVAVAATPTAKP
jgi:TonB family protein